MFCIYLKNLNLVTTPEERRLHQGQIESQSDKLFTEICWHSLEMLGDPETTQDYIDLLALFRDDEKALQAALVHVCKSKGMTVFDFILSFQFPKRPTQLYA